MTCIFFFFSYFVFCFFFNDTATTEIYTLSLHDALPIYNEYNKVFLTGLNGSQDVFDLKILDGSVEFDYIIDPSNTNFNSTWDTSKTSTGSSNTTQIKLPLESSGTYNFNVDWGDGNSDLITTYNQAEVTHNYASAGVYNVSINGTIIGFRFNNGGDRLKISDISNWGDLNLGNSNGYFYGASNLDVTATDQLNLTGTTNMYQMFYNATNFNGNISNWDTSKVTTMYRMFWLATNFNGNINNWDTSSVTSMYQMFYYATNFNQNISNWNTSKVTTMGYMFYSATNFNGNISNWDTSSVTTMSYMFRNATNFNGNISNWDTSSVIYMQYMFYYATNFNQDIGNWNVSSVTTMVNMFYQATNFNGNISNWDTSKVTTMYTMFYQAANFNQNLSNWNVSSVTTMYAMFRSATNFNQNISNWNTSKVTNMRYMFQLATNFNQNLSNWDTSSVTTMDRMFNGATNFNQNLSNWDTSSVTNMYGMFNGATNFNGNISNWDVSSVTTMTNMFYGVTLSTTNYDSLLNGWASLPSLQLNVVFSGGNSKYSSAAVTSRNTTLIGTYSWTITDGGFIDIVAPTYSNAGTNTTGAGTSINFSIQYNDNTALNPNGQYIFSTNNTGIWVNDSTINFTTTPEWANVIKTLNSTVGISIGYRWYANDNAGNVNDTGIFNLVTTSADTCTYTSGNWGVTCSDNCSITSNVNLGGNNLTLSNNNGYFEINANISNFDKIIKYDLCEIRILSGGFM